MTTQSCAKTIHFKRTQKRSTKLCSSPIRNHLFSCLKVVTHQFFKWLLLSQILQQLSKICVLSFLNSILVLSIRINHVILFLLTYSIILVRCAVITGANKGIGLEICRQLASNGIMVILTARDERRGLEAVENLKLSGLPDVIIFHQLDVTNIDSISSLAKFIGSHFGKLDILVRSNPCYAKSFLFLMHGIMFQKIN